MFLDVAITVIVTSFIQSIFGVGVLLFGTPLLLLLGYDFIEAVIVLLPISVSINAIQIVKDYRNLDVDFYKRILVYAIPFVVASLFIVTLWSINVGLVIGLFLLLVAVKDYSLKVKRAITFLVRYERAYVTVMGIVHGLTNLGGSLLTAIVHSKEYEKDKTRVTVALAYATFAVFQMLTLLVSGYEIDIRLSGIGIYLIPGITVFMVTEKLVYTEIDNTNYSKYFAVFLFFSGLLLCIRSV
jgi:uncharacterized membrane protein YfcA